MERPLAFSAFLDKTRSYPTHPVPSRLGSARQDSIGKDKASLDQKYNVFVKQIRDVHHMQVKWW